MHLETLAQRSTGADAPWGRTAVSWHDVSCVRVTYEHCTDLSAGTMPDDPLSFPYARSTFEVLVPDSGRCGSTDVRRINSERYPVSLRVAPPPYSPDSETERACCEEIATWMSHWIDADADEWLRGQAIAAHNAYVSLYKSANRSDAAVRAKLRGLARLVCPAVPWLVSHGDAAVRTWALLHYVMHYTAAANALDALRREGQRRGDDDTC
jgi:hypothetical protein